LIFDFPVERAIELRVNGAEKFAGQMVSTGKKRACLIETVRPAAGQGKSKGDES